MSNQDNFNKKIKETLEKYSKTTESMFKYQQKVMQKQYDTILDVVKTVSSINFDITPDNKTAKTASKAETKAKPTASKKPIIKSKPIAKKAEVKKETVVKAKPAKKAVKAKTTAKPKAKAKAKYKPTVSEMPKAKMTSKKVKSKDRLEALKKATKEAVKVNHLN